MGSSGGGAYRSMPARSGCLVTRSLLRTRTWTPPAPGRPQSSHRLLTCHTIAPPVPFFKMAPKTKDLRVCFAPDQHLWCRGSQPKHISNPDPVANKKEVSTRFLILCFCTFDFLFFKILPELHGWVRHHVRVHGPQIRIVPRQQRVQPGEHVGPRRHTEPVPVQHVHVRHGDAQPDTRHQDRGAKQRRGPQDLPHGAGPALVCTVLFFRFFLKILSFLSFSPFFLSVLSIFQSFLSFPSFFFFSFFSFFLS